MVEVWQTRLKEDEEQLRLDRVRSEEGKIPPFYVQRGEAEVAETQQQLTNAQRDVELSLVQLKTVMGIHLASQVEVLDTLSYQPSTKFLAELTSATPMLSTEAPTSPPTTTAAQLSPESVRTDLTATARGLPADLAALLRLAERQRPALRAAGQRIRAAQAAEKAIDSAYGPQVNAFVMGDIGKSRFSGRFGGTTFGVVASLPIFNGGQKSARLQTAQAERRLQEAEQEKVVLQIVQEVSNALLNLRAAEQNIQTAQAALKSAGEDYRVARLRYEAGKSTVVEALDARAAQIRAKSNVIQALYSYNVARDQLLRATGI
jgi:outer membrane protein TolC